MNFKIIAIFSLLLILTIGTAYADENETQDFTEQIQNSDTVNMTDDVTITEEIEIAKPTTIYGNNHTITADNTRIFKITADNVTLKDIVFINGFSEDFGGSITASGSLNIINCTFLNSSASLAGAVYTTKTDSLNIIDSTFINCTASIIGMYKTADAIYSNSKINNIAGCIFDYCFGSVALIYLNETDINEIINSTFHMSSEIYAECCNTTSIIKCSFNDSYSYSSSPLYTNSLNNTIIDSEFIRCSFWEHGGAITALGKNTLISGSRFFECTSLESAIHCGDGGAVYLASDINNIKNCEFKNCSAESGGAVNSKGNMTEITNSSFHTSTAIWGGAISIYNDCKIDNCSFEGCNAGWGGAILLNNAEAEIINSTFKSCTADEIGGAVYANGYASITDSNFSDCNMTVYYLQTVQNSIAVMENNEALIERCLFSPNTENVRYGYDTIINESTDKITFIKNEIDIENRTYTANTTLSIKIKDKKGKDVINKSLELYINDNPVSKAVTDNDSIAEFKINLENGIYQARIVALEDDNYYSSSSNIMISVSREIIIHADNVTKYYGGSEGFNVKVTDGEGNPISNVKVSISINGGTYTRTTKQNGEISPLPLNLNSGEYTVLVNGEYEYTVLIRPTVEADDVAKVFRNATTYNAKFLDSSGNTLSAGLKVDININGVFYKRTIRDDGTISFNLNLVQGTYVLTTTNPVTHENIANTVVIIPRIVENNDLVKYYKNDSQYTFKLLGDDGNPIAGEKASININGVFYRRTTDEMGQATFQINLNPGKYVVTVEYKDCRVSNKVTVLHILNATDLTKKYGTPGQFKVSLVDGRGNPYPSQTVAFNINGVLYSRTTHEDGIAALNIYLMPGEYIITSSYNGVNLANKVTVTGN